MPRYRVTLRRTTVEIVEAANPYQAAIIASDLGGEGVEVANVAPATGRPPVARAGRPAAGTATPAVAKARKKRRPLSPEAKARLAQNLVKARAGARREAQGRDEGAGEEGHREEDVQDPGEEEPGEEEPGKKTAAKKTAAKKTPAKKS